ncbi:helix-turn-helix domain-containing protein [Flavobacterium pedocola]
MLNLDDFIKRLENIFEYYGLSASSFADKIGVQRSSMSHLLSGRNKPSLDFIMKIVEVFPEVDLYWILNGSGNFPKGNASENIPEKAQPTTLFSEPIAPSEKTEIASEVFETKNEAQKNRVNEIPEEIFSNTRNFENIKNDSEIDRIVVFYKNGTFKNYIPE